MEKVLQQIWDGVAQIEVPQNFAEATVGERRKIYGMGSNIPVQMLIDREQRVFISASKAEEDTDRGIEELAQNFGHILIRNVPGYKCMGMYQKEIDQRMAYALQYTFYAQELNRYTILFFIKDGRQVYMLNCTCNSERVPQMHPVFLEIIESIKFI